MSPCRINIINSELAPDLNPQQVQIIVDAALQADGLDKQQVNVLLVDSAESAELHRVHFDDPHETDVMSFPDSSEDPETGCMHLGDLAVCVDVAKSIAEQRGAAYTDEVLLYIIHGLLHLLGYDDIDADDRQEMWDLQRKYLALITISIEERPDQ